MWSDRHGQAITCAEKRKMLDETLQELCQHYRDALDDALLMGCGEAVFRQQAQDAIAQTKPTVKER